MKLDNLPQPPARTELIGSWRQKGGASVIHLRADGCVVCEGYPKSGGVIRESGIWRQIEIHQLQLILGVDPQPGAVSRNPAEVEVVEYDIVSITTGRMTLTQPEFEFPVVYERIISPAVAAVVVVE